MLCRWRRHLLDPKRELHIGPGMHVDVSHLYDLVGADKPLREGDLNYSDKQHWSATNRIFSIETLVALQLKIGEWEHKRDQVASTQGAATSDHVENPFWGTFTFIKMGYHLKAAWLEDDDPHDAIHHAAWALTGILNWRFWLDHRQKNPYEQQQHGNTNHYTAKRHFMTRETFLDTVISLSTRILMFPLYRGELDGAGSFVGDETARRLREWKPIGNRVSSRFSEYGFANMRMKNTNTPAMGALAATSHLKHYWAQMMIDSQADFEFPTSKRGVPTSVKKTGVAASQAPVGYWDDLTDAHIKETMEHAKLDCTNHLKTKCHFERELDASKRREFFSAPCLHFPKMETFRCGYNAMQCMMCVVRCMMCNV